MKKSYFLLFIAPLFMAISCSTGSNSMVEKAINDYVAEHETFCVLAINVGDDLNVPAEPSAEHLSQIPTSGAEIYNNVWLTNRVFYNTVLGCLGCDECMTTYAKAGLIDYVKGDNGRAKVTLTAKGMKYRIENFLPDFEVYNREGVEFVVLSYSRPENIRVISNYMPQHYFCEADVKIVATPFLECMGYDESKEDPERMCKKEYWKVEVYSDEEYEELVAKYEDAKPYESYHLYAKEYIFSGGNDAAYDLNVMTKEQALEAYLSLSDSTGMLYEGYMEWDGMYISNHGKFSSLDNIPQSARDALLYTEGRRSYFLLGTHKLGKIISDKKMPTPSDEKHLGSNRQLSWNLEELYYTVEADYTEFGATVYNCPEKVTYYGKIPYIVFDNVLYFIPDANGGLWAYDKELLKSIDYCQQIYVEELLYKVMRPICPHATIPLSSIEK